MGRNKITRWLDNVNGRLAFSVASCYYRKVESGRPVYYILAPRFYLRIALRILIIIANLFRFDKKFYIPDFRELRKHRNASLVKQIKAFILDLTFSVAGLNYFIQDRFTPKYYEERVPNNLLLFQVQDKPLVSIIVPVFNQLQFTLNCLRSIRMNVSEVPYEIIVVDDCSTDQTSRVLSDIQGLVYIRNSENLGFLLSCNLAAGRAKGEYLCLLNNDTLVQPKWLETLVQTIQADNAVGAVGSKLIYPYGLLQEAGGIIFSDASGANYGKFGHLEDHKYNYLKEVDYCSGASLLFRKGDFEVLGGFDVRFSPAYYEDTDLCFSMRYKLNKKVMYQPDSQLVHFEGISSGKVAKGANVKSFQTGNQQKFVQKWKQKLDEHHFIQDYDAAAQRYVSKRQILVVDSYLPKYDKESGSNRLFQLIMIFKKLGYHIIYVPNDGVLVEPYYRVLTSTMGVETLHAYQGKGVFKRHINRAASRVAVAWICRPNLNYKYSYIFKLYPSVKWIYDTVDLHYVRLSRAISLFPDNKKIKEEFQYFKKLEIEIGKKADVTVCITDVEQKELRDRGVTSTVVIPNIHNIKTARGKSFEERSGIIFIGGYDHHPNIDAALFLCKEIMPLVWRSNPDISLTLLGSDPPAELLALRSEKVMIPGFIPDVSSFFESAKLMVAPLRFGAGMKGKIGQSFEYALPVITTSVGAEGMNLKHGENILIADDAPQFASEILKIYTQGSLWAHLSENSRTAIVDYSTEVVFQQIKEVFERLGV